MSGTRPIPHTNISPCQATKNKLKETKKAADDAVKLMHDKAVDLANVVEMGEQKLLDGNNAHDRDVRAMEAQKSNLAQKVESLGQQNRAMKARLVELDENVDRILAAGT
ncbi:hypothetical protein LTS10_000467 [Elasticomyces elasticus]|nr:hypothetical protein LTS10_000467 [Elasticomyces elasticus]